MTTPVEPVDSGMTPAQLAILLAIVQTQAQMRGQITRTAVAAAVAAFRALAPGDWWDDAAVRRASRQALRIVQPSQQQVARITDSYLARALSEMTGKRVAPVGAIDVTKLRRTMSDEIAREIVDGRKVPGKVELGDTHSRPDNKPVEVERAARDAAPVSRADTPASLPPLVRVPTQARTPAPLPAPARVVTAEKLPLVIRDDPRAVVVDPAEPYERVAAQFRSQVAGEGREIETARARALVRVASVAATDVTLAVRDMYEKGLKRDQINGWRRILHPELSETGPCGLCTVASDRIYTVEDLMPLHADCVCEVLPIVGKLDPGVSINDDDLKALYKAAGGTGGNPERQEGRLKDVRVILTEHGEIGPVLVDGDQHFRGPREVAETKVDPVARKRHQLEWWERANEATLARQAAGETVDQPLSYQRKRIDALRRELVDA